VTISPGKGSENRRHATVSGTWCYGSENRTTGTSFWPYSGLTFIRFTALLWLVMLNTVARLWKLGYLIPKYDKSVVIQMFCFFKHRLLARKFKNSSSTETPVGHGRALLARVMTDYNLASVSSKGRKFGVHPVLGKRRTD